MRLLLDDARQLEDSDPSRARALVQQARVLARSMSDEPGEAEALYRLAGLAYAGGQPDDAFSVALEAQELAHKCGAAVVEVWALNLVGIVHYNAGNYSEALLCSLRALELYRTTDHRVDEGNLLNTIAVVHHSLGDLDRAIVTYEAALTANKGLERPENDAVTLANMAKVRAERNENLLAVSLGESALELAREHAAAKVPDILARLGEAYGALNALDRASSCLDDADAIIADRAANGVDLAPQSVVAVQLARGNVLLEFGRHEGAVQAFEDALRQAKAAALPEAALQAHQRLAQVYKELGQFEAALDHQEARFTMNEELFNRGTDLRIKTLQIAHDTEAARHQAEILRLRTGELEALVRGRTQDLERYQLATFQRVAALANRRGAMASLPDTSTTSVASEAALAGTSDSTVGSANVVGDHTECVGDIAGQIVDELGGESEWGQLLALAGRLHDIGMLAVADAIVSKPGPLTAAEREIVKTHAVVGWELLSGSSLPLMDLAAEVALSHHERWDGSGYPSGLAGDDIPLSGRVVAVAEVYDALTSDRSYRRAWSSAESLRYIVAGRGTQFEPRVVDAFLQVMFRHDSTLEAQLQRSETVSEPSAKPQSAPGDGQ